MSAAIVTLYGGISLLNQNQKIFKNTPSLLNFQGPPLLPMGKPELISTNSPTNSEETIVELLLKLGNKIVNYVFGKDQ